MERQITKTELWRMNVGPLRDALEERGLDSTGDKTALQKRLKAAIFPDDLSQSQSNVTNVTNNFTNEEESNQVNDDEKWDLIKVKQGPVFKRIPKASRLQACLAYIILLNNVIKFNDKKSWEALMNFARCAIGSSKRGGKKKKSQATILNKRIDEYMSGTQSLLETTTKNRKPPSLKQQVSVKMALADIKGAVRLLVSKDTILSPSEATIQKLKGKHPPKHPGSQSSPEKEDESTCFKTNKDDLLRAIRSFPKDASGGPDGLLPQHLCDMCEQFLGEPALKLVDTLVSFMNLIVYPGKVPKEFCETFYGANLIALSKEDGGVRPIAVGFTLRRLAAKIVMHANKDFCTLEFSPHQLGVGCPKGAEIAVHAVRSYLQDPSSQGKVLVKIDFKNAFNCIRRDVILNLVKIKLPKIYNYVHQCYDHITNLRFGSEILDSSEGVQQGDPLGPFLFSLGIQEIVSSMESELNVWYLDDGTLGGDTNTVFKDLEKIKDATITHGLEINPEKCELFIIGPDPNQNQDVNVTNVINRFDDLFKGIKVLNKSELSLLGAPIFPEAINSILNPKLENLKLMASRLIEIDNHEALFLLRHCFAMPKLTYFLRTSPCFLEQDTLEKFDKIIKDTLVNILNISLPDTAYKQATLPIAKGGLGLRLATEIALSGFLSSVCATKSKARNLLPMNVTNATNVFWDSAFGKWKQLTSQINAPENPIYQSEWDKEIYEYNFQNLLSSAPTMIDKARLLAVSSESSSDWLHAVPVPSLGLKLDPMTLKISCGLRLGSTLCHQYQCVCGVMVESNGRHGLSCRMNVSSVMSRHNNVNNLLKRALVQAKIPTTTEPVGLSRKDGKRPDGLTLVTWKKGKCLLWDFTCADTLCQSYVKECSRVPGAAAEFREKVKNSHYKELEGDYCFFPIAVETFGSWGSESHKLVKEIGKKVMEETGEKRSSFYLFQNISIAIQRGNASCVLGTIPHSEGLEEIFDFVTYGDDSERSDGSGM